MELFDKVLGKDSRVRELEKEIRSLEVRKSSVFASISGEINRLENERTNVLLAAGTKAYATWKEENQTADLLDFWNQIQTLEKQIEEQEEKRTEMGLRYDEEIRLIQRDLQMAQEATTSSFPFATKARTDSTATTGLICPNCGASIGSDDMFCQSCGTKLK